MSIRENLDDIRQRLADAARRAGRGADDVRLMAVSKTFPADAIREAYEAGQRLFGENRVQEFAEKSAQLPHPVVQTAHDKDGAPAEISKAEFHLIGHLQSNKSAKAAELFDAIDSVDSLKLLQRLNDAAGKLNKRLGVLIEVNVGGEEAKSGLAPESPEVVEILRAAPSLEHVTIRGLMTVPPYTEDPKDARPYFRRLRDLRETLELLRMPGVELAELSMGMSHDFEVAVEEGSTCVRVGTAIFGKREKL